MNRQRNLKIIVISIIILSLVAIGLGVYYFIKQNTGQQTVQTESTQPANNTDTQPKDFLTIGEWGVILNGIESKKVAYTVYNENNIMFVLPDDIAVSEQCKDLGIGMRRFRVKDTVTSMPESTRFINGAYYTITGGSSECDQPPDSPAYKTYQDTIDHIIKQARTYNVGSIPQ